MKKTAVDVLLIVEDNEDDAMLIEETLSDANFAERMVNVRNGDEALEFLRRDGHWRDAPTPSMILLDVKMPKKDGVSFLREIKKETAWRHIPVIIFTAHDDQKVVWNAYAKGACSYIVKPPEFHDFCDILRSFVWYWKVVKVPSPPEGGRKARSPRATVSDKGEQAEL